MSGQTKKDCGCGSSVLTSTKEISSDPFACTKSVTAEVCSQATVSLTPLVTPKTPIISCIDGPLINEPCPDIPGFEPFGETGKCTFTVSQVICVTIPLDFAVDVKADPSGGAYGPIVPGTECPPLPFE